MIQATVRLEGGDQALRALATMEPTVGRQVKREISSVGKQLAAKVTAAAQGSPPVSGWVGTPAWPAWAPVKGVSSRRGAGIVVATTSSEPRIAHMHEYMGNLTKSPTSNGRHLAEMMNSRFGSTVAVSRRKTPGRLGVRVIGEEYPAVIDQIKSACDKAVDEVNRRMP